jgi:hypothetical protein
LRHKPQDFEADQAAGLSALARREAAREAVVQAALAWAVMDLPELRAEMLRQCEVFNQAQRELEAAQAALDARARTRR